MPRNMNIFKAFAKRIKAIYGDKEARKWKTSLIGNPINSFKGLKRRFKGFAGGKKSKHATLKALGMMVRARVINGPELNILMAGIPFLIDFGISYGMGMFRKKQNGHVGENENQAPRHSQVEDESVSMTVSDESESVSETDLSNSQDLGSLPPLPMAPYSDQALKLMCRLIGAGMSADGAGKVVSGEHEGEDLSDYLSEKDCEVFGDLIGTVFLPVEDGPWDA